MNARVWFCQHCLFSTEDEHEHRRHTAGHFKLPTEPEPPPTGEGTPITELVIEDLRRRNEAGTAKYGTPLRANNGRDPLVDAYQEALDLCQYLRQAIEERRK